jgi:hypothetical protein
VAAVTRLILAYTPYHVLIATAGLSASGAGSNHLVIVNDFGGAAAMADALRACARRLFDSVDVCGGSFGVTSRLHRQFRYRQALAEIRNRSRDLCPAEIWVGNDARPESQAAFRSASRQNGRVRGVYVEDGLTAYATAVRRPLTALEHAAGLLIFGRDWNGIEVLGTSRWISSALLIFPELARPELQHLQRAALGAELVLNEESHSVAAEMVRRANGGDRIGAVDAIVTTSHSTVGVGTLAYRNGIAALVRRLIEKGCTVGIKYHPREAQTDYLGLAADSSVVLLPRGLPLEYLYILSAMRTAQGSRPFAPLRFIVGDVSTTLLTARWLVPDADCISLARPLRMLNESLEAVFTKVGVRLPVDLEIS